MKVSHCCEAKVLLFCVLNADCTLNVEILHKICARVIGDFGQILRIVVFGRDVEAKPSKAMVEFDTTSTASFTKEALDGAEVETESCTLRLNVYFAKTKSLQIKTSNEYRRDFSLDGLMPKKHFKVGNVSESEDITSDEFDEILLKLNEAEMELDAAHKYIRELQSQLGSLNELFKYREEEVTRQNTRLKKYQDSLVCELTKTTEENKQINYQLENFKHDKEQREIRMEIISKDYCEIVDKIQIQEKSINDLIEENKKLNADKSELDKKCRFKEIGSMHSVKENLRATRKKLARESQESIENKEDFLKKIEVTELICADLKKTIKIKDRELSKKSKEIEGTKECMKQANDQIAKLRQMISELKSKNVELACEQENIKKRYDLLEYGVDCTDKPIIKQEPQLIEVESGRQCQVRQLEEGRIIAGDFDSGDLFSGSLLIKQESIDSHPLHRDY